MRNIFCLPETGGEGESLTESSDCPEGEDDARAEHSPSYVEPGETSSQQEGGEVHCWAEDVGQEQGLGGGHHQHQRQEGQYYEQEGHDQSQYVSGAPGGGQGTGRPAGEKIYFQGRQEEQEDQRHTGQHHQVEARSEIWVVSVPGDG